VATPRYRNAPVELPERYDAVRDALLRGLDETCTQAQAT
jgi:hypothetical protein